ncbi:MAG TPA: BolA/IbaG family iron-sulfur metabolism protein [Polyangiaceae bacterium]|jgi:acid stress-induced BolA-like protein IbaG/YrbA|nr:BolA/IbaG family iron-sulfur metabolism protein [Polyangiaceae bacterium]
MSHSHGNHSSAVVLEQIKAAVVAAIPDAKVEVSGGGGHYSLAVISTVFAGKNPVQSQRVVYSAIKHLMAGDGAPVHAVDSLKTSVP